MRTEKNGFDHSTGRLDGSLHLLVDGVQGHDVEITAAKAGLVCCDNDFITGLGQAGNRFQRTGQGNPFIRCLDERIGIFINHTIAVQNNEFHKLIPELRRQFGYVGYLIHHGVQLFQ